MVFSSLILRNCLNKTCNRVTDLRKEIQSPKKSVLFAEEATVKAMAEYEAAEPKLEVVDGQPVQSEKPGRLKRLKGYVDKAKDDKTSIRESLEAKDALLARALEENKGSRSSGAFACWAMPRHFRGNMQARSDLILTHCTLKSLLEMSICFSAMLFMQVYVSQPPNCDIYCNLCCALFHFFWLILKYLYSI
uniref:Nuclear cap-binding protein subunit 1-like isoform X2 n=2 Tax=Elaeis guineensis var. tenera TaxID=51953 RepID=A0A8N4IH04_ELAGV|nr:nuclear cap-binding protein subunit 1-like isoform X2 [Elaeis guineensis]